jgi:hypothetical protein
LIFKFAIKLKLKVRFLSPKRKMKVGTLGWDYNEFINRSSKGDPLSQKEKK